MTNPIHAETNTTGDRWYVLPTGERLMSVTTVLSTINKPFLTPWAAKLTAEAALDLGPEIVTAATIEPCNAECGKCRDCLKAFMSTRHIAYRDEAGDRGSRIHDAIEHKALFGEGGSVDDDARPYVDAYRAWEARARPMVVMAEATVFSRKHGYAGTLDAILGFPEDADLPKKMLHLRGKQVLADYKSGKSVDRNAAFQAAAYRFADGILLPDGEEVPMHEVDTGLILHIRPEGVQMREAHIGPKTFNEFLFTLRQAQGQAKPLGEFLSRPAKY